MQVLFYIACFLILSVITLQDFKSRSISWVLIPLLFVSTFIKGMEVEESEIIQSAILSNSIFIIFQLAVLIIYFSIKTKRVNWVVDQYIGWGDILFLLAISPVFCFGNFILFTVVSLMGTLLFYFGLTLFKKNANPQIPLAGIQSMFLMGWFAFEISTHQLISHQYLLNYFVN